MIKLPKGSLVRLVRRPERGTGVIINPIHDMYGRQMVLVRWTDGQLGGWIPTDALEVLNAL